jgi:hypothetical protein
LPPLLSLLIKDKEEDEDKVRIRVFLTCMTGAMKLTFISKIHGSTRIEGDYV